MELLKVKVTTHNSCPKCRRVVGAVLIAALTAALGFLVISISDGLFGHRIELDSGLVWEYRSMRYSSIVHNGDVVLDGNVGLTFGKYGLCFTDESNGERLSVYYDMISNRIERVRGFGNLANEMPLIKGYDASSAMGVFCDEPRVEFERDMEALRDRVSKRKAEQFKEIEKR